MSVSPTSATQGKNAANPLILRLQNGKVGTTRLLSGYGVGFAFAVILGGGWGGSSSFNWDNNGLAPRRLLAVVDLTQV